MESTGTLSPWQLLQWLRRGHSTKIWPNVSHEMSGLRPGSLRWTAAEPMSWIAVLLFMICSSCQPRKSLHAGCKAAKCIPFFFGLYTLFIYYLRVRERERTKREHYGFGNDLILVCADNSFCRQASEPLFPLVFITAQELILIKRSASLRLMSLIKSTSNVC